MDKLVSLVAEKVGISEDMARTAVETVVNFLKDKLPAPVAGQIDRVLEGDDLAGKAGDIAKGLGGLFGKK
jgi:hypothetical protein